MNNTKTLFDTGVYSFTIISFVSEGNKLTLTLQCDVGEKKYQVLKVDFPTSPRYLARLKRFCNAINYEPFGQPHEETYGLQFVGMRCNASVVVTPENNVMRNHITDFALADEAEIDVWAERTETHFFKENKPKKTLLSV